MVNLTSLLLYGMLMLPVWWAIGIEQFVYVGAVLALFPIWLLQRKKDLRPVKLDRIVKVLIVFLAVQMISAVFIEEVKWYFLFFRNYLLWLTGLIFYLYILNLSLEVKRRVFYNLPLILVRTAVIACAVVLIAYSGLWSPNYLSPLSFIIPDAISTTEYFDAILRRQWVSDRRSPFFEFEIYRPFSFFLYSNTYSAFLILTIPVSLYLVSIETHRLKKGIRFALSAFLFFSLLMTTSRASLLALVLGGLAAYTFKSTHVWRSIIIVFLTLIVYEYLTITGIDLGLHGKLAVIVEGRGNSYLSRLAIYEGTIMNWQESPVFGWGTTRNASVVGLNETLPPLGTHSTWLGMLYRFGVVGMVTYSFFVILIVRMAFYVGASQCSQFGIYLKWIVLTQLFHSAVFEIDLDAVYFVSMFSIIILLKIEFDRVSDSLFPLRGSA